MKEIVLSTGRFASVRPITWWDKVLCAGAGVTTEALVMGLACRVTTIDGEPLTLEMAQAMELHEANPIIEAICQDLLACNKSKGVA